jgi:hypothetical protein
VSEDSWPIDFIISDDSSEHFSSTQYGKSLINQYLTNGKHILGPSWFWWHGAKTNSLEKYIKKRLHGFPE